MEIILSNRCKALTGSLGCGFGYYIQRRTDLDGTIRFWGVRKSKGAIPADGHWRFIVACAELANIGLHITDIRVGSAEMHEALSEAGRSDDAAYLAANQKDFPTIFRADDVINLKHTFGL